MVAIRCSIRLEVPLGQMDHILVTAQYVHYLVTIANDKMEANRKRTESFLQVLQCKVRLRFIFLLNIRFIPFVCSIILASWFKIKSTHGGTFGSISFSVWFFLGSVNYMHSRFS